MLGPLEAVLAERDGVPAEARQQVEVAHRNGLRLLKLVNALLDFSRIEAGRLKASFDPLDLGALTADLAGSFRSLIEASGLRFRVETEDLGEPVYVDADLWEKVVLNLLSNAFKYTLAGEIRVETGRSRDGRSAQIRVSDTGVGIPKEELPRLFERFHRVEGSRGRSFEGTGIGLALVQELVRLHGGAIEVESEVDAGTTFTVTIPLGSAHLPAGVRRERSREPRSSFVNAPLYLEEAATWLRRDDPIPQAMAVHPSETRGGSVIVADDNADMRDFLKRLLGDEGLSVVAVDDGVAALEAARLRTPDAIVSDVMMPRLDGLGLLSAVREDPVLKNIPFILLSARAGEDERVRGVASGADDYLSKPFSGKELVTRVATQIRLKRLRQQAYDAIAASEQRLRLAQEAGRIAAWQFDPRSEIISSHGSFSRLWGLEDSLPLTAFTEIVHVEDRARFERALTATAREGVRLSEEFRLVRPDTLELAWLAARAERQVDGSETAPQVVGVAFDITEQRMAETQLRHINEYLKATVEERTADRDRLWALVGDLMLVARFDADIVAVNPAFTNVLGWKPEEMVGTSFLDFVHPDDRAATEREAARLATGSITHRFENRYRAVSGEWRWISWTAAPDAQFIHAVGRDVTEEKLRAAKLESAEAQLRQAQKMEAVGQLTGGIAHDFNNLLAALMGSLELIRRRPTEPDRVVRFAEAALQAAERGARLTAQLLTFSRSQDLSLASVNASELIEGMADLLDRTLGPMIEVRLDLKDASVAVSSDRTQLEMAVLNLAINSRDAMPNGGRVTIEAHVEKVVDDAELADDEYVAISVSDNGPGMPADVIARAFDPFFTTKGVGKGTGLGLSQVYGLAKRSRGTVRIKSAPGAGTTVVMFLPVAGVPAEPRDDAVEHLVEGESGGSVLLVDDDPDVRRVLVSSLEALGYVVIEAATGAAALEVLNTTRPDWLVVDFAMPGMNGAQMAAAAWKRYPELPTVLISGYSDTAAVEAAVGPNVSILRKPFRMGDLQRALARREARILSRHSRP